MKKIFAKDKKNRNTVKQLELKHFILKQIYNDSTFSKITIWKSVNKLTHLNKRSSKTYISNRCVKTTNKKTWITRYIIPKVIHKKVIIINFLFTIIYNF